VNGFSSLVEKCWPPISEKVSSTRWAKRYISIVMHNSESDGNIIVQFSYLKHENFTAVQQLPFKDNTFSKTIASLSVSLVNLTVTNWINNAHEWLSTQHRIVNKFIVLITEHTYKRNTARKGIKTALKSNTNRNNVRTQKEWWNNGTSTRNNSNVVQACGSNAWNNGLCLCSLIQ
jgi:hypothetical protein